MSVLCLAFFFVSVLAVVMRLVTGRLDYDDAYFGPDTWMVALPMTLILVFPLFAAGMIRNRAVLPKHRSLPIYDFAWTLLALLFSAVFLLSGIWISLLVFYAFAILFWPFVTPTSTGDAAVAGAGAYSSLSAVVFTSTTSWGALSRMPAGLMRMKRARSRSSARLRAPR